MVMKKAQTSLRRLLHLVANRIELVLASQSHLHHEPFFNQDYQFICNVSLVDMDSHQSLNLLPVYSGPIILKAQACCFGQHL